MDERIRKQVYNMLHETLDDDSIEIRDDSDIVNDLELSSLELSEMLSELEEEYGIRITNSMLRQMVNVGNIIETIVRCVEGT